MRDDSLRVALFSSCLLHIVVIMATSTAMQKTHLRREEFLPVSLVVVPQIESPPIRKEATPPKVDNARETEPIVKSEPVTPAKEEPARPIETQSSSTHKPEIAPSVAPVVRVERGGSEAGAGNLFGKGDVGVILGPGTAGGGGGTAASGLGRGSGTPGLPAQTPPLRINREAKPIQTVKANYPPMAQRMGMESDVTLRIEVDPEGRVTHAEITRSGGAGFDDEALKAVKQSRFEPAQSDGHNVPAEFIYIYRFRLQR